MYLALNYLRHHVSTITAEAAISVFALQQGGLFTCSKPPSRTAVHSTWSWNSSQLPNDVFAITFIVFSLLFLGRHYKNVWSGPEAIRWIFGYGKAERYKPLLGQAVSWRGLASLPNLPTSKNWYSETAMPVPPGQLKEKLMYIQIEQSMLFCKLSWTIDTRRLGGI